MVGAFVRPSIFSAARRAAVISTRAIWCGPGNTKACFHIPRKVGFSKREGAALFRSVSGVRIHSGPHFRAIDY